jgi:hypothetical protein
VRHYYRLTAGHVDGRLAFGANARAYLNAICAYRPAAMVLTSGDSPAGFDEIRRSNAARRFRRWFDRLTT